MVPKGYDEDDALQRAIELSTLENLSSQFLDCDELIEEYFMENIPKEVNSTTNSQTEPKMEKSEESEEWEVWEDLNDWPDFRANDEANANDNKNIKEWPTLMYSNQIISESEALSNYSNYNIKRQERPTLTGVKKDPPKTTKPQKNQPAVGDKITPKKRPQTVAGTWNWK